MKQTSQGVKTRIVIERVKNGVMQLTRWLLAFTGLVYISFTMFLSIYCIYYAFTEEDSQIIIVLLIIYACESFSMIFPRMKFIYDLFK